ncbi:hypothetical protein EVAR_41249_1 [Eumeta japonica]|uniref:Uncharacterized protein n=1 Tax=Eumeta variegata TaxID=151549 RepID=A0A4C1W770_EUMVA|nr:hypothetical protein EVAR_41249_1 [Eumeta japonica]
MVSALFLSPTRHECNKFLAYIQDLKSTEADPSILNLCQYRLELAEALSKVGNASELCNKRGRPSTSNSTEKNLKLKNEVRVSTFRRRTSGLTMLGTGLMTVSQQMQDAGVYRIHSNKV